MQSDSKWPARISLFVSIVVCGALIGPLNAFGQSGTVPVALQTTTASPTPSGSRPPSPSGSPSASPTPCRFPQNPPVLCPTPSPSPSASGSPTPTPSPTGGDPEPERHDSKITIGFSQASRNNPAQFDGLVKSVRKCKPKRAVILKRVQEGPDLTVGSDTTNRSGEWRIVEGAAKGRYYAKVKKRVFLQGDVKVICKGARSRTLTV